MLVKVAIDKGDLDYLRPGADVMAKIHCGRRSLGYVWFHDVYQLPPFAGVFQVFVGRFRHYRGIPPLFSPRIFPGQEIARYEVHMVLGNRPLGMLPLLTGAAPPPSEAQLHHCLVSLIEDVQIPAEVAGVLVRSTPKRANSSKPAQPLVQINENEARFQRDVALAEERSSREKADNDVNVRYADAARKVAQAEYELNEEANKQHPGTVPVVKMQELWLKVKQAELQIEQAEHEQTISKFETEGYKAKVDLADEQVRQRKIKAPIKGEVVEVLFREGEWVEPGNPVLRIVRLDRLRIEGFLNIKDFSPSEVGKPAASTSWCRWPADGRRSSMARLRSSIRWYKPAASIASGPKSSIARKTASGCCGRAWRPT